MVHAIGDEIDMEDVVERHRAVWKKADWFAPEAMRFFKTALPPRAYVASRTGDVLFVTSEKGPGSDRAWTLRRMDWTTGEVRTVGPWNSMTKRGAEKFMRQELGRCRDDRVEA